MALLKANTGIGTTNPTSSLHVIGDGRFTGVVTAITFSGQINAGVSTLGFATASQSYVLGITTSVGGFVGNLTGTATNASYASTSGIATYATNAGVSTYASTSGISTYSNTSGIATYSNTAGIATYSNTSGIATYSNTAGIATYATTAGVSTIAGYASTAGIATVAQNLTGSPNITVSSVNSSGVVTASSFSGSGSNLTGIVTSIEAGTGISINQSTGKVTISNTGGGGGGGTVGLTIKDEGGTVGTVGSITTLNFVGDNITATAAGAAATITITTQTYIETSGVSTYATSAGIATYATTAGVSTYASTAGVATALQNSRTFEITGDIVASPISFDGTGNVSLAATIQPNSVALGTDTTGDYVQSVSGTANQITVTSGTGEGSAPTLSIPSQFTAPQDVTVTRDLQVNRNLNVNGNITVGGTSATLFTTEFKVYDPDIVLGFRTDGSGNDVSNDTTANHGGIAIASTEGSPLVNLFIAGIETTPATYKKLMWFKSGTFSGLGTDAWLSNYAVGIGSTQFPTGTRLAAGNVQFTQNDLAVIRNINASGVITATSFSGNASSATYASTSGIATYATTAGIATYASTSGIATYATTAGIATYATTAGIATYATTAGIATYASTSGIATYASNAGVSTYATNAGVSTNVIGGISSITQLQVTGVSTFSNGPVLIGSATSTGTSLQILQVTGNAYVSGNLGVGTTNPTTKLDVSGVIRSGRVDTANEGGQIELARSTDNATAWYVDVFGNTSTPSFRIVDATAASARLTIDSAGTLTATKFSGDGSLLTGITAAGSGVVVQNQGSTVGTAATINFSTNLTATFDGGVATITASGGGGGSTAASIDLLEIMLFS